MNPKKYNVFAAKFNSEQFWDSRLSVKLPAVRNKRLENIVHTMDELMFAFCKGEEDMVLTTLPMNQDHLEYLHSIGFPFQNKSFYKNIEKNESGEYEYDAAQASGLSFQKGGILSTYAVIPEYNEFAEKMHLEYMHPDKKAVSNVNSKLYSTIAAKELGFSKYAVIVRSEKEFLENSKKILQTTGSVLVKEEYGVSGKGNLRIQDEKGWNSIAKNISMQCKKGKEVRLILEPAFQVKQDFSVQYRIEQDFGKAEFLSIQQIWNKDRVYNGSINAEKDLLEFLEKEQYFALMEKLCGRLYQDGYFGDVCVDSMILDDNTLVPIVEINARKSMSLIKKSLEKKINASETCLFYVDTIVHPELEFSDVLMRLSASGLLYTKEKGCGIIVLTAQTLLVNTYLGNGKTQKGRIYFLGVGEKEELLSWMEQIKGICDAFSEKMQ